ncbi:23002_t:CDS:2 [Cetraspora pellucida]|uniref:23002_t:CDS:1 n=1 Tax=Cetraspora pellucida TaxID=1433469 RepID=A0A9N9C7C2_9GLOM|nr:23002_t:CDS:2 [Cetraspora pellucida]
MPKYLGLPSQIRDPNNCIKQQARDQLKKKLCKENQIALGKTVNFETPEHDFGTGTLPE